MMSDNSPSILNLTDAEIKFAKELGLSDHEVQVYRVLLSFEKQWSAQDVASELKILPNAVYRIFSRLKDTGLIRLVARHPIRYEAVTKEQGFQAAYLQRKTKLEQALRLISGFSGAQDQTYIAVGRQKLYEEYIRLASAANKEIAVYAIGIAYSEELFEVQKAAIERGVYIRHVVQKLMPSNYHIVHKWQKLGVAMRHLNEEQGFHLTLVDKRVAMVTFSDPENTEDRFSVISHNSFAVRMFQAQFESIWQQAQKIDTMK